MIPKSYLLAVAAARRGLLAAGAASQPQQILHAFADSAGRRRQASTSLDQQIVNRYRSDRLSRLRQAAGGGHAALHPIESMSRRTIGGPVPSIRISLKCSLKTSRRYSIPSASSFTRGTALPRLTIQIAVNVEQFDSDGKQATLIARWSIRDGHDGKELYATETTTSAPLGAGAEGPSAALSATVAALSREIAAQLTNLGQHPRPAVSQR